MEMYKISMSVAKCREDRYYQNPEELSEMAKTCTLTFNTSSAANLDLGVLALHRLTRSLSFAEQPRSLPTRRRPKGRAQNPTVGNCCETVYTQNKKYCPNLKSFFYNFNSPKSGQPVDTASSSTSL